MSKLVFLLSTLLSLQLSTAQDASVQGPRCPPGFKLATKNTCIKVTKVNAKLNCPAGFEAFRGRCKKVTETDAEAVCQNGFAFDVVTKKCNKTITSEPRCPKNFQRAGDKCIKKVQVRATCKKGAQFSGGKCVQQERKAPDVQQSCRDGFQLGKDKKCRKQEKAIAFCKDGQLVDGARCKTTQLTGLSCADGYKLVNNRCERRAGFKCSEGKLTGNKCIITTERPAICPKPFVLVNGRCQKPIVQAPSVSCPNGGKFDSKSRKCIDIRPLSKACREGFSGPDSNGKCTKKTTDIRSTICPAGSKPDGSRCKVESHPQESLYCRSGFHLRSDKKCYGSLSIPAIKKCEGWGNYVHTNGKCHHHDVDPKICPNNYHKESNGRCRCRSKDPRWCPHGKETHARCASGFRELPAHEQRRIGRGLACIKAEHEVKTHYSCISKSFQLRGDRCYRTIVIPAAKRLVCRKEQGHLLNGRCVRFVNRVCQAGYHLRDGKCFRVIVSTEDAKAVCPSGFHQRENQCVRITDAKIECSSGLNLDAAAFLCRGLEFTGLICEGGLKLQGNKCVGTTTVDAQCPSGFQSAGQDCVQFRDAVCPSGFTRQGDKCAKDVFSPAQFRCGNGNATLQGELCIIIENATVTKTCPEGYIRDGDFCLKTSVTPAVCPEDFTLNGLFCEREISAEFVCRKGGFKLVGNICEKNAQRDPRFQCSQGSKLQKKTNKCITILFENGTFSCEEFGAGFELKKGGKCQKREVIDADGHGKH